VIGIDEERLRLSKNTDAKYKSQLGQFLTPLSTANFMANIFVETENKKIHLLDAGAGIGILSSAFIENYLRNKKPFENIHVTSYEIDDKLITNLKNSYFAYKSNSKITIEILNQDFIENAVNMIQFGGKNKFTHAILNPPYKKISSNSRIRKLLRIVGIETVNLYSAFVSLSILLMQKGGQIVVIIPRSFCNGPYYKSFRKLILSHSSITHIHLFGSRVSAFKDDDVLQENVIIKLDIGEKQSAVVISHSTDNHFTDYQQKLFPFSEIIDPNDKEKFIHIPDLEKKIEIHRLATYSLSEIGVEVSTGPVVDFRLSNYLYTNPRATSIPIIYPLHFSGYSVEWPKNNIKKPNYLIRNKETEKWLLPNGYYCLVKRFSSKEEPRRIVACVFNPINIHYKFIGFENHINVFHINKMGLPEYLAKGLFVYLNSTMIDDYFRRFSGHTQVNATDLRMIKYPSRDKLVMLGEKMDNIIYSQEQIDHLMKEI
jgi:adenine-specific DNA-methyltransferase